jgi:hypothetical protein
MNSWPSNSNYTLHCHWSAFKTTINGPDFLKSDKSKWPVDDIPGPPSPTAQREMKKKVLGTKVVVPKLLDPAGYSNWPKLVRVTAWILRFCHNLRKKDRRNAEVLSVEELKDAELFWIKFAQQGRFGVEIESLERLRYPGFGVRVRAVSSCFTDVCNSIILFLFSCNRQ